MKTKGLAVIFLFLAFGAMLGCKGAPHRVTLTWDPPPTAVAGNTIAGYNVYRSTTPGKDFARIAARVPYPWYEDRQVSRGQTYFYVVTTVDSGGSESKFSGEVTATIP
jgi:fibronectin type 3 domain-containing protein